MSNHISIMPLHLSFIFKNRNCDCEYFIDKSEYPCLIFVVLKDSELIEKFGDDITIKTDGHKRMPKKDDYPDLIALRQTLFDVIRTLPDFIEIKSEMLFKKQFQNI